MHEDDVARTIELTNWELRILFRNVEHLAETVNRHMPHTSENQPTIDRWDALLEKLK